MSISIKNDSPSFAKPSDYAVASPRTKDLLMSEAEKRLAFQMSLFASSDTRAVGILSAAVTLGAAAVALAGLGFEEQTISWPLVISGSAAVCLTSCSAYFALRALFPKATKPPGWYPSEFLDDLAKQKTLQTIKAEIIDHYEKRLRHNKTLKESLDKQIKKAMLLLAIAPLCALLTGALTIGLGCLPENLKLMFL